MLGHLVQCSLSHKSDISSTNLLVVCTPQDIWGNYTAANYPIIPEGPGDTPEYFEGGDAAQQASTLAQWCYDNMLYQDYRTMNECIKHCFLASIPSIYLAEYDLHCIANPNKEFQVCFQWFIRKYGQTNEHDREQNKQCMSADWNLHDR